MLGLPLNAGFTLFARFNETHDLIKTRLTAFFREDNIDFTVFNNGSGKDRAARFAVHRQGFAGHRGLIHLGVTRDHLTVHRDLCARAYDDAVLCGHIL